MPQLALSGFRRFLHQPFALLGQADLNHTPGGSLYMTLHIVFLFQTTHDTEDGTEMQIQFLALVCHGQSAFVIDDPKRP